MSSSRAVSFGSSSTFGPIRQAWPGSNAPDATVWPTFGAGCHAHRDTRTAIEEAGFTIKHLEQLRIPDTRIPGPTSPHILGTAAIKEG